MTCREFVARYSEYRDGLITAPREARRFARHLASCAACQRYDAALQRGIGSLQTEGQEPDRAFRNRLERRLASERAKAGRPALPARPALAAALLVAVAIGLVAWEVAQHRTRVVIAPTLPPVPFPKPVARAGLPFVSFQDPRSSVVSGNPYPYGTVYVEPAFVQPAGASSSSR
jgi:anti-sigma factor RsiW